jgi:hypothetical protein
MFLFSYILDTLILDPIAVVIHYLSLKYLGICGSIIKFIRDLKLPNIEQ